MMQIRDATDFSLKYTLESGQSFRWNRIDDAYYGVVEGRILKICQVGTTLRVESSAAEDRTTFVPFLQHYLDLGRDVPKILTEVNNDAYMHRTIENFGDAHSQSRTLGNVASFIYLRTTMYPGFVGLFADSLSVLANS